MPKAKDSLDAIRIYLYRWRERGVARDWMIIPQARYAGEEYVFRTTWSPGYQNAWVFANMDSPIVKAGDQQLNYMTLHELVHLTQSTLDDIIDTELNHDGGLYKQMGRAIETTTDKLTAIIWRAYEGDNLF